MRDQRQANEVISVALIMFAGWAFLTGSALMPATWVLSGIGVWVWWRRAKRFA